MVQQILIGSLCVFIGALISYFVTTLTTRNIQKAIAKEITSVHEQVHHKEPLDNVIKKHTSNCLSLVHEKIHHKKPIEKIIKEHIESCPASTDYKAIKAGLIFLVTKANGNLHDLGLS